MKVCQRCQSRFQSAGWTCLDCGFAPNKQGRFHAFAEALSFESESFNAQQYPELFRLESGNFWFRARNKLILWAIRNFFPASDRFLEVGCGTGYVLSAIRADHPQMGLTGAELLELGLEFAFQRIPEVELIQMDARDMPFDQEFDLIGCFDVIEHIREDSTVLRQFNAALSAGGGLILTVPQHMFLWSQSDEIVRHCRRYSADELTAKLEAAGFEPMFMSSFVFLLLPLFFLSRLAQRLRKGRGGVYSELQISGFVNFFLEYILNLEVRLIKMGIRFPVGSTLLMVARKRVAVPTDPSQALSPVFSNSAPSRAATR